MLHDPEEAAAVSAPCAAEVPPETTLGALELTVSDLDRSVAYYEDVVGLSMHERNDGHAILGGGETALLDLREIPGSPPADGYSGLYHMAFLVPERRDLARWLAHAARDRVLMAGASDHFVSEALYLRDPDHHGIEIYWDRPRQNWEGMVGERMTTLPLDVEDVFRELDDPETEPFNGLPTGTELGHVHLRVANVPETVAFYRDVIGFGLMAQLGDHAGFLSAGGYHHHIGVNSWETAGRRQAPDDRAKLRRVNINLPDSESLDRIAGQVADSGVDVERDGDAVTFSDPSGNPMRLRTHSRG
jgi:catechol 2,3-dioxygenase